MNMKLMKSTNLLRLSLFSLLFTQVLSAAVGLDLKAIRANAAPAPCILKVQTTPQITANVYALGQLAQSVPIQSGITELDTLKLHLGYGGGAVVEPFLPAWYFSRFPSNIQAEIVRRMPSILVRFQSSPVETKIINGVEKKRCNEVLVQHYRNILMNDQRVSSVSELVEVEPALTNYLATRVAPNDPHFSSQYDLSCTGQTLNVGNTTQTCIEGSDIKYLRIPTEPPTASARKKVVGFILDSGVWLGHPDLDPSRFILEDSINVLGDHGPSYLKDDLGHAQHVLGKPAMITNNGAFGAGITDNNPDIKFAIVRMFSQYRVTTDREAVMAVLWPVYMVDKYRREGRNVLVASNNSWGTIVNDESEIPELKEAVLMHLEAGAPFVNAAGNGAVNNDIKKRGFQFFPAGWAKYGEFQNKPAPLIAVSASDYTAQPAHRFTNYGYSMTVFAPGVTYSIVPPAQGADAAYFGCDCGYLWLAGTSMASPIVFGESLNAMARGVNVRNLRYRIAASSAKLPQFVGLAQGGLLDASRARVDDDRPPNPIVNPQLAGVSYNRAKVSFVVPEDNDSHVGLYDLRFSTEPVNDRNFWFAKQLPTPWPKDAGEVENLEFVGLPPKSSIYIAVRVIDWAGNYTTTYLPPFNTKPAHITWFESTGNFSEDKWESSNTGSYTGSKLWQFKNGRLVYQAPDRGDYNTTSLGFPNNEGLMLSPWLQLPENPVLRIISSRNTGIYYYSETGNLVFSGDYLFVRVYRERGKSPEMFEFPRLRGTVGHVVDNEFDLSRFSNERVRIGFYFRGTQEFSVWSGIRIYSLEIYGTRNDEENLPQVPNGNFDRSRPSTIPDAPNWLNDLEDWTTWQICPNCERAEYRPPEHWFVKQDKDKNNPEHGTTMWLEDKTGEGNSYVLALSNQFPVRGNTLYELVQSVRVGGSRLWIQVFGYDANGKEYSLLFKEIEDTGAGWLWEDYALPFTTTTPANANVVGLRVRYTLLGRANTERTIAGIDSIRVQFMTKTFPSTSQLETFE